jgi:cytochrome c5
MVPVSELPVPAPPGGGGGGRGGGRGGAAAIVATGPDAAVATLVNTACSACHTVDRIVNKKGDNDAWTATVTRMKGKGAALTDEQVQQVIEFLARTHGQ